MTILKYHILPASFGKKTWPIWFILVDDDFARKYVGKEHVQHRLGILKEFQKVEEDRKGSLYCEITLDWYYDQQYDGISMVN